MNAPQVLRHYCRNVRCRQKLPGPTDNERAAFCCRGCWESFHRRRCIVCGEQFTRKAEHQRLCRRAKCKSDFRRLPSLYRRFEREAGHTSGSARRPLETSIKPGIEIALEADRAPPWVQVAGPALTVEQFHLATLGGST